MTTITLETIKAEHTRLAELIAQFEAQPASKCEQIHFTEVLIDLSHGEHYAGLIVGKDGEPSYHLVLTLAAAYKDDSAALALYLSACDELNRAHQIGAVKEAA